MVGGHGRALILPLWRSLQCENLYFAHGTASLVHRRYIPTKFWLARVIAPV